MANKRYPRSPFKKIFLTVFVVLSSISVYYLSNYLIKQYQYLSAGAALGADELFFFEPSSITLSPNGAVELWVSTGNQLGFISTQVVFDQNLVKLTKEVTLTNASLKRIVKQTSMAEANSTGKINLVIAVNPSNLATAPTGSFSLARLQFAAKTSATNVSSVLGVATSNSQLVNLKSVSFVANSKSATLNLNPVSLTPTTTTTLTPTPTITGDNSAGPVITVKSPAENYVMSNDKVWIGSVAADSDGISVTNFFFDNKLVKTCKKMTTCNYTYRANFSSGSHVVTIESFDNSPARNRSEVKINVLK